jgi:predicted dehydrogenase
VSEEIRWGIVGPGRIADKVVRDFSYVDGADVVAVGSRSAQRAQEFANRHGVARSYGSYRELLADPDVDVLYVATTHAQHHAVSLAALGAGKALLVEKPFTATSQGAAEVVDLARRTGVFAMEGIWTRFMPAVVTLRELIADGAIGEVRAVQAELGSLWSFDPAHRLFDPAVGGGALLDMGVYTVAFAQMLLGNPESVTAHGSTFPTGVDADTGLLLGFSGGRFALLTVSLRYRLPGAARIIGTAGWIDVHPRFHQPDGFVLHREGAEPETFRRPRLGGGYAHELIEVTECLRAGRTESAVMPLADTLAVQTVLGEAADQLGVRHAEDDTVLR